MFLEALSCNQEIVSVPYFYDPQTFFGADSFGWRESVPRIGRVFGKGVAGTWIRRS